MVPSSLQMKKTGLSMKRESSSSLKKHAPFRSFEKISLSLTFGNFFEENGTAYFAMELIEGCNLRVFRKNHNPKQTLKMALQMLFLLGSSLAEVHRFGMIHGDISPENILITQDGEIKLIDFGAARSFRQGSDRLKKEKFT